MNQNYNFLQLVPYDKFEIFYNSSGASSRADAISDYLSMKFPTISAMLTQLPVDDDGNALTPRCPMFILGNLIVAILYDDVSAIFEILTSINTSPVIMSYSIEFGEGPV